MSWKKDEEKDGKDLKEMKDLNVNMHTNRIIFYTLSLSRLPELHGPGGGRGSSKVCF